MLLGLVKTNDSVLKIEKPKRFLSIEAFHERYSDREDGYKYEWNNGIVEKSPRTMNKEQYWIVRKLLRLFQTTEAHRLQGELIVEAEMFLPTINRTRKPDLAYLTDAQIEAAADKKDFISAFVIEIISTHDKINKADEKLDNYFGNDVQVVWRIFPLLEKVEVYTSPLHITICRGNIVCSAAPVLPDFCITAEDLFKR